MPKHTKAKMIDTIISWPDGTTISACGVLSTPPDPKYNPTHKKNMKNLIEAINS